LQAIDRITQDGRAMTFFGDPAQVAKPDKLVYGSAAILHHVRVDDAVVAPAEAAKRGWVQREEVGYHLSRAEALVRVLPIIGQLGSLYNRGAKTTVGLLDLVDLDIEGGGRLRLSLQDATPVAMKRLSPTSRIGGV
jgi:hypothetical protein